MSSNIEHLAHMNTQEIITPLGKLMEWSFETILVPMSNPFNLFVVVLGVVGSVYWLTLQKNYTKQAEEDGTIV